MVDLSILVRTVRPMSNTTRHSTVTTPLPGAHRTGSGTGPVRFPLSTLRPGRPVLRAAEKCRSILRHPRSRVRINPGWHAPSLTVALPCAGTRVSTTVHISRHRITPRAWEQLTGTAPAAPDTPLFFATLSARASTGSVGIRDLTVSVHSLFRRILNPAEGTGPRQATTTGKNRDPAWVQQERCARPSPDDTDALEWVWHALLTQDDLESAGPSAGPHSSAA